MPIKNLMDKLKGEDDYVELETAEEEVVARGITIQIERMATYNDTERIQQKVRDGLILLVKIKDLRNKNLEELKRAVAKIQRTCSALNGDIAGLGSDWLIVTPGFAKVHREPAE